MRRMRRMRRMNGLVLGALVVAVAGCRETEAPKPVHESVAATAAPIVGCSPSCADARYAEVCGADGRPSRQDCGAKGRRCVRGVCAERLCKPGELHCDQGELYRCDENGSSRALVKACRPDSICMADEKK